MDTRPPVSPREELQQLRNDGRLSDAQYTELLDALDTAPNRPSSPPAPREPEFRAFRKRVLVGGFVICLIGIPAGLLLKLPHVTILGILGIIVTSFKLHRMRNPT